MIRKFLFYQSGKSIDRVLIDLTTIQIKRIQFKPTQHTNSQGQTT